MKSNYFLNLGLHEPWAILPEYAHSFYPVLAQLLQGNSSGIQVDHSAVRLENKSSFVVCNEDGYEDEDSDTDFNQAPAGAIAILKLNGPVMKYSQFCGPKGTVDLAAELKSIDANPNFIGTIFKIESGGGQAYAIKPLTDVLSSIKKPVVVLAGNTLASAAYAIASYSKEIVCDHPRAVIGSIGGMISFQNVQPALEKLGIEFHEIYADQSVLKNKTYRDALSGKYDPIKTKWINPLTQDFIDETKAQRKGISSDKTIFQGETFLATEAMELGMVDHLGDLEFAVSRVKALSKETQSSTPKNNNTDMKFPNLMLLAGLENPTEAQLAAANAELTTAGITHVVLATEATINEAAAVTQELTSLQTAHDALVTEKGTVDATLVTANSTIASLNARIAQLPGAQHTTTAPTDPEAEVTEVDEEAAAVAELPHNKMAEAYLG